MAKTKIIIRITVEKHYLYQVAKAMQYSNRNKGLHIVVIRAKKINGWHCDIELLTRRTARAKRLLQGFEKVFFMSVASVNMDRFFRLNEIAAHRFKYLKKKGPSYGA